MTVPHLNPENGSSKATPHPSTQGAATTSIKLTKKEVVRRELATAIRLFISGGDPVAIHVLANAASAIIQPIAEKAGHETWRTAYLDIYIKDEHRQDAEALLDEWYNFMKHGARDPDVELATFNPEINQMLLFLLCRDYAMLFKEMFSEAAIYMATLGSIEPRYFTDPEQSAFRKMVEGVKALAGSSELTWEAASRAIHAFDAGLAGAAALGIDLNRLGARP